MLQSWRAVFARFRALLRSDAAGVRAGFYALLLSSGGDLVAGLTLGSITGTLEALPGLLVLVPADALASFPKLRALERSRSITRGIGGPAAADSLAKDG